MKINFTKREYRILLEIIFLADWMLHAHKADRTKDSYRDLEQKIMSSAGEFGCEDWVEYVEELDEYVLTTAFDEADTLRGCIEDYDEATFWNELISKLAARDILRRHSEEELAQMTGKERVTLYGKVEDSYADEFEINGLNRIKIE